MNFVKVDGTNQQVIMTLHGTGGSATDLFSVAKQLDANATLIGFQGEVYEGKMARYFARYPDGSFDFRSLAKATYDLKESIDNVIEKFQLQNHHIVLLGYSNGANLAISYLKEFEDVPIDVMLLYHSSLVRPQDSIKPQDQLKVLITSGENDPFVTKEQFQVIKQAFIDAGIETETYRHSFGHQLIQEEIAVSKELLDQNG